MPALNERSQSLRASRVGASEVPAILGIDPYRGPMTVWGRIVLGEQPAQTPPMAIGAALEGPIARLWATQAGERIRMNSRTRTRGNLAATADGFCLGRGGLLEVKWSAGSSIWRGDELPESVYWQCAAQAAVYGSHRITVVALIGADLREWTIDPPRADRRRVIEAVNLFFTEHIEPMEMPIPMYPAELDAYLRLVQGTDPEARRAATDDEQTLAASYIEARTEAREAEATAEAIRRDLLAHIATNGPRPRVVGDGWVYQLKGNRALILDSREAA
jgi:hypothetical protein